MFGQRIATMLPGVWSSAIGAVILSVLGLRILLLIRPAKQTENTSYDTGFVQRRKIGFFEIIVLGISISLNAFGNGLGAGAVGLSPLEVSTASALFSFAAIWIGVAFGQKLVKVRIGSWTLGQFSTVLSGIILLFVAAKSLL
ncbi:manganese efflux pump [Paenibacillus sp. P26]|nr:manganese efflux pump [Paenibacillus sp. P26]UUZ96989.1 manganese efflux pump [Paenibacillus sp. P25]